MNGIYTNILRDRANLLLRGRNKDGKRFSKTIRYEPYVFLPTPPNKLHEATHKSLKGQPLSRVNFENIWEYQKFMKQYKEVANFSVFGFDSWEYVYLSDNYPKIDFMMKDLSVGYIDIEVYSEQGFPTPEKANGEVTVITIAKNNKFYVLSTYAEYKNNDPDVIYVLCKDERELLARFLALWEKLDLDILSGWNSNGFDIPYLVNRIHKIFDLEAVQRLSPWRQVTPYTKKVFGHDKTQWTIAGISHLDYLDVYKKFVPAQRESYKLGYIGKLETGETKLEYKGNLNQLWREDKQLYIDYNIQDVRLLLLIERKKRYLELACTIAYDAKVNFEDALGSVKLWEVLIHNHFNARNEVAPIQKSDSEYRYIEGGYVKEPVMGLFDWIVSFDVASLYPHVLMGWNISPETFVHKREGDAREAILNGMINVEDGCAVTGNQCYYRTDIKGFVPELMEEQFQKRKEYKDLMKKYKKLHLETNNPEYEELYFKYNNFQQATKIKINSLYGALGNEHFKFYSADNAEAVTWTGQIVIRWASNHIDAFLNELLGTKDISYVVYCDTDSAYINVAKIMEKCPETDTQKKVDYLDNFCKTVMEPQLKIIFDDLAVKMNCSKNVITMNRDIIAEKAIWRAKKNYAALLWDEEGVRYHEPKMKLMGLEPVRSNIPEVCREAIKTAIMLTFTEGEDAVQKFTNKFRKEFNELPLSAIARPTTVKDYSKYMTEGKQLYQKGSPIHVKASIVYNHMIKQLNLDNDYKMVYDGDKIKYLLLKKLNPIGEAVIGAPDGDFPKELALEEYVDRKEHFQRTYLEPMQSLLDSAGWRAKKVGTLTRFFQ